MTSRLSERSEEESSQVTATSKPQATPHANPHGDDHERDQDGVKAKRLALVPAPGEAAHARRQVRIDMTDYEPPPAPSRAIAAVAREMTSGRSRYQLADVSAIESGSFSASLGEAVETKAGFTVFIPKNPSSSDGFKLSQRQRPVVVNVANGQFGIVTGTLIVKLKDFNELDAVEAAFGLEVVTSDDTIATAYYRAPIGVEVDRLVERIRKDPRVVRADAEIVQAIGKVN